MARYAALPNLSPAQLDIDLYRGDSFSMKLKLSAHHLPVFIEGFTFSADIRTGTEGDVLTNFGITHLEELACLRLTLTSAQTQMLPALCIWDLQYRRPVGDSRVQTILRGEIATTPDVTYVDLEQARRSRRG